MARSREAWLSYVRSPSHIAADRSMALPGFRAGAAAADGRQRPRQVGYRRAVRIERHAPVGYGGGLHPQVTLLPRMLEWLPMGGACGVIALRRAARAVHGGTQTSLPA
jgi:hypothetical protein